jgi:hypothetical protein
MPVAASFVPCTRTASDSDLPTRLPSTSPPALILSNSMPKNVLRVSLRPVAQALLVTALSASAALAQAPWQQAPSGRATTTVTLTQVVPQDTPADRRAAPLTISIDYGQPHARGRAIAGALIPNGEVWRLGANEATMLTTTVDLEIGGQRVPKGSYSLFALASPTGMQLIVSRKTGPTANQYDPAQDLVRIAMQRATRVETTEALHISLEPTGEAAPLGGTLRVQWGTVDATVGYTAKP